MAYPADAEVWNQEPASPVANELKALRQQVNNLINMNRALMAKLDADGGVSGTDYAATLVEEGATDAPSLIVV